MDDLLKSRKVPTPSSNLAERIIEQSKQVRPVAAKAGFRQKFNEWLETLFDGLLMPRPAYVMALVLFIGVFFGAYLESSAQDTVLVPVVYTEDDFNTGEWL